MSTHPETENEQKEPFPSVHTQKTIPEQAAFPSQPSPPSSYPKKRRWFVVGVVSTIIVLLLTVSVGAIVLTQLGRQPVTPTPTPTQEATATTPPTVTPMPPPAGQWEQVLNDYHVTSLAAAPSHPNVLYACAVAPGIPVQYRSVQTVLRSEDFGAHWQDIGSRAQMSRGCELTINPTNSDEIYVATDANPPTDTTVSSYVLEHTSNGGESWETIHPTVHVPGLNAALAWQGAQLSFAGNRLYSLQALPLWPTPTPQGPRGWSPTALGRLLMSTDGGHTWNVLDTQLATAGRSAGAYAVNPAKPAIFYELAYVPTEPGTAFPPLEVYKSVDGGNTWQPVLKGIPYTMSPMKILIGSENTKTVYITNAWCPGSQAFHAGGGPLIQPLAGGPFSLCMSSDEGRSWRAVAPAQVTYPLYMTMIDRQGRMYGQATPSDAKEEIWRYDPTSDTWSKVTQAPREGDVLAGTPTGANDTTILWLMTTSGQAALYRYVI